MKRPLVASLLLILLLLLVVGRPAVAWSEDADDRGDGPGAPEPEAWEPEAWEPEAWEPEAWEPEAPGPAVADREEAAAAYEPEGIYLVTETYVRDVVTVEGPRTTYSTETLEWSPGTYARELETVGTGVGSSLDGTAFNGRTVLSDGRSVAGTFYENFVRSVEGFVPVSVVFFQDDAELARARPSPVTVVPDPASTPATVLRPASSSPLETGGIATPGGTELVAEAGREQQPGDAAVQQTPTSAASRVRLPDPIVEASFAVRPGGRASDRVEVLRGRRIVLWPRVTIDGVAAVVLSWRLDTGVATLARASGAGGEPFVGRWDRLTRPGASYSLRFGVSVAVPGEAVAREVMTAVEVAVLSPALER